MEEQIRIFELIKQKISSRQRLSDVIEELLGVSSDSAYRRIRGETELTFSELKKICRKFNLSMDEVMNYKSHQGALFHYDPINLLDIDDYLVHLKRTLDAFLILKSAPEKEIIYTARSIPLCYLIKFPDLAFLNLFTWNNVLCPTFKTFDDFCNNLDKERLISMYQQTSLAHSSIPTREIWTVQTLDVTLRLIDYFYTTGVFEKKETVLNLLNQLSQLIDTVHKYSEDGHRGGEHKTPFALYNCSVSLYENCMLIINGSQLSMTIRLHMVNFIETSNEVLCDAMLKWQRGLISKSTLISGEASAMHRFRFFEIARNNIEKMVMKVKK